MKAIMRTLSVVLLVVVLVAILFPTIVMAEEGLFVDSGQNLGYRYSTSVAAGDLDGDGDLDGFVANNFFNKVWLNDGSGIFRDSGGNQKGMKEVAEELNSNWARGKTRVHYIPEYYDYPGLTKWLEEQGIKQESEGIHDDYGISSIILTVDPTTVRMKQRLAKGLFSINGVDMSPAEKAIEMGKKAVEWRANITVKAIRKAIVSK